MPGNPFDPAEQPAVTYRIVFEHVYERRRVLMLLLSDGRRQWLDVFDFPA